MPGPRRRASSPLTGSTKRPARQRLTSRGTRTTAPRERDVDRRAGKYGAALTFNGTNNRVTRPRRDLARPDDRDDGRGLGAADRSGTPGAPSSSRRQATTTRTGSTGAPAPASRPATASSAGPTATCARPPDPGVGSWTHLATTYDGNSSDLYVNGVQAATLPSSGNITTTTGALRIGGNNIWGEWFSGLIDEVRVYNRALTLAQIQNDMNTSISTPDTAPPTAPGSLTAVGLLGSTTLGWGAASDNVGVVKYDVYRSITSGFAPSVANRIAQPTTLSYTDTGLAPGPTTTASLLRTPPATWDRRPRRRQASPQVTSRRRPHQARSLRVQAPAARDSPGERQTTTWRWPGTTCTGRRRPASRRPQPTASRR